MALKATRAAVCVAPSSEEEGDRTPAARRLAARQATPSARDYLKPSDGKSKYRTGIFFRTIRFDGSHETPPFFAVLD